MMGKSLPTLTGEEAALLRSLAPAGAALLASGPRWALVITDAAGSERVAARPAAAVGERLRALGLLAAADNRLLLSHAGRVLVKRLAAKQRKARPATGETEKRPRGRPRKRPVASEPARGRADQDDTLAWLRRHKDAEGRPFISAEAFEAGERLRADFLAANMLPRVTQSWNPTAHILRERRSSPDSGLGETERVAAAAQRVRRALAAVGPEQGQALIDLCCHSMGVAAFERKAGWPRRSGTRLLKMALETLARHYGLLPPEDGAWLTRLGLLQWGASDYKPSIDG